ncbi:membrane protein [Actinoplanes cyaneus]|uniref:Membrane protein n=1 Tax=Actinoplanes cyaneus TaxID=52696 RepID=A0A919MCN6_9ACTN|nr:putative flippase GtrA (transmembrane translocase of bactoprenol-linked glucose) [Actinoplanes cyaneus]GID66321.1 membrane protein [Actinoplanes cyaneus]
MPRAGTFGPVPPNSPRPAGMRARLRSLAREASKFGAVGAVAFGVDLIIFNLLLNAGSETLSAKTISTVIATTLAFIGNRFWTWRDGAHTHLARQYTTFFVLNAIGLGIALACLAISHYGLGHFWPALRSQAADNVAGQLVGTAIGTIFRFWSYRKFVFRADTDRNPGMTSSSPTLS